MRKMLIAMRMPAWLTLTHSTITLGLRWRCCWRSSRWAQREWGCGWCAAELLGVAVALGFLRGCSERSSDRWGSWNPTSWSCEPTGGHSPSPYRALRISFKFTDYIMLYPTLRIIEDQGDGLETLVLLLPYWLAKPRFKLSVLRKRPYFLGLSS